MELTHVLNARARRAELNQVVDDAISHQSCGDSCRCRSIGVGGDSDVGVTGPMLARRVDAVEEAGELGSALVSQRRTRRFDETWRGAVAEELDHRDLLSGSCRFFCRLTHDLSVIVVVPERACNTRCHAGNDDADVIGVVRIILRDSSEDIRPARVKLHQVARNAVDLLQ